MHDVEELFSSVRCRTRVWVSQAVIDAIDDHFKKRRSEYGPWLKKLKHYAQNGFGLFEGENLPISPEWGGVFRISIKKGLFRVIGFYDGIERSDFIAIDAFLKKGQDLTKPQRERIDAVVTVRKTRQWKKRDDGGNFPRLA